MCNFVKLSSRKNLEELFGFFFSLKSQDFGSRVSNQQRLNVGLFIVFKFQYCTMIVKISGNFLFDQTIKEFY